VNAAGRDFFARRILFPIDNLGRRTIGFGGRTLEKENPLKYLNTGETRIFKKSRVLFGWTQAVNAIDRSKSVVLVEGYFDAVILHQEGFSNTVALLGTAVTLEQAQLLSRKVRRATLLLDPDDAGVMAALKGCFSLLAQNIEPSVAILPEGVDPDEMALKSRSGLNELLSSPLDMLAFLSTVADRFFKGMRSPEFLDALAQNLRGLPTSPLMEMALREIAESMGVEARTLQAFLSSKSGQSQGNNAQTLSPTRPRLNDVENIEELIAKLLVNTPELSSVVSMDEYFYPYTPGLKEVLDTIGRWDPEVHNEQNYIELFPDYMREFVEESITEDFGNYEQKEKMLKELIARWKIKDLDNFIKKLKEQIAASPNDSLLQQLQEVLQEREEINRRLQGLD
jgi:DNA primase